MAMYATLPFVQLSIHVALIIVCYLLSAVYVTIMSMAIGQQTKAQASILSPTDTLSTRINKKYWKCTRVCYFGTLTFPVVLDFITSFIVPPPVPKSN